MMSASESLREATARTHEKLEEAHLAQRLQDGSIERQTYVDHLRAIAVLESITMIPVPALDPLGAATLVSAIIDQQSGLAKCADSLARWVEGSPSLGGREREE